MRSALVTGPGLPPQYTDAPEPQPADGEIVVDVLAAAIHPLTRSRAAGTHYSDTSRFPLIPGVDGVGRDADGVLRYFALDAGPGSMAQRVAIDPRRSIPLPDDADPVTVAAGMNPAMSSWIALRSRIRFAAGQSVLVLGATGAAGGLAVEVARLLGAARIVAAGRDATRLAALPARGATAVVRLGTPDTAAALAREAADVDIVLDYVWGDVSAAAMTALVTARPDRSRPLTWVQIGSTAGPTTPVPAAALRAARLQLVGSGIGSVPVPELLAELPELARILTSGGLQVDARPVPLADVESAWTSPASDRARIVLVPDER